MSGAGYTEMVGWNASNLEEVQSMYIGPYDPDTAGAITIYSDDHCSVSSSKRFNWNPSDGDAGTRYSYDDLMDAGLDPTWIRSVRVPQGYVAEFFTSSTSYG